MMIFRDVAGPVLAPGGSVVTVGAFDGLHLGHRALLAKVRERAQELDCMPAAVSFEPLPRAWFAREPLPRLASVREKLEGLRDARMQSLLLLRFNASLTAMSAEDFVHQVLMQRMAAREVWVGADFRFGHKRQGDLALLQRMGEDLGFTAHAMPPVTVNGERVSSSVIRARLAEGDFAGVQPLLGRPFRMGGRVVLGKQLGRELGYPTANVRLGGRVPPVQGIFAVQIGVGDGPCTWPGVASLGVRPTVNEVSQPLLEAHLFDFDGDLYGRGMNVEFVAKLREEEKFADVETMVAQIHRDAQAARQVLGMNPVLSGA